MFFTDVADECRGMVGGNGHDGSEQGRKRAVATCLAHKPCPNLVLTGEVRTRSRDTHAAVQMTVTIWLYKNHSYDQYFFVSFSSQDHNLSPT